MATPSASLATDALGRRVDDQWLIRDVSMEVREQEVFVVFGPSGAGKSTLLRLLNRLDEPTVGTVYLHGEDYRTLSPRTVRTRIGLVPQQPTLVDGTVADNVQWGRELRGVAVDDTELDRLLERLGLEGFRNRRADDLSGGEAQRVAIARTLFNEPEIVLLDEPASSLDANAARRVERLLQDVIETFSLTAVLVTHDADRARRLGTRGLRLDAGRPVRSGRLDDVLSAHA